MKIFVLPTLVCSLVLGFGSTSGVARAQQEGTTTMTDPLSGQAVVAPRSVVPSTEVPVQVPPAPPVEPPPPPVGQNQQDQQDQQEQQLAPEQLSAQPADVGGGYVTPAPAAAQPGTAGQWVYTEQYGWIWMPYGTQYTYEGGSDNVAQPYSYAYYPAYGWMWLAAPWVWGWGGYPYFGVVGPWHYPWYRGLYHAGYGWGGYRGGYAHAYASGYRGFAAHGAGYGGGVGASPYRGRPASAGGYAGAVNRGGSYGSAGGTFRGAAPVNAYGRASVGGDRGFGFTGGAAPRGGFTGGAPHGGTFGSGSHGGGFSGGGHSFGGGFRGGHGGRR
jgi:hypothetical protein